MADPTLPPSDSPRRRQTSSPPSAVRLAQLVRTSNAPPPARDGEVVIEVGGARITVGAGADLATVVTIVAMLGGRL